MRDAIHDVPGGSRAPSTLRCALQALEPTHATAGARPQRIRALRSYEPDSTLPVGRTLRRPPRS